MKGNWKRDIVVLIRYRMLAENKEQTDEGLEQSREEIIQLESRYEEELKFVFSKKFVLWLNKEFGTKEFRAFQREWIIETSKYGVENAKSGVESEFVWSRICRLCQNSK